MQLSTTTGIVIFENDKPTLKETISDAIQSGIKNMDNINLSDQTLTGIDLSGISLSGAYFKDASITDSKFIACKFEWADFALASFDKCDFSKSEFIEPYFSKANFKDCSFRDSMIKGQTYTNYDSVIFNGSDMTGVRMRKINFNQCDFGGVSMQQSVLHQIEFRDCHVSDMSLKKSFLSSVQACNDNFGDINLEGIIANSCDIKGLQDNTDLEFLPKPFNIETENKITVYRYNYGNTSPFRSSYNWDYESKAVSTKSGFGIYGYTPDMSGCRNISIGQLGSNVRNKISHTIESLRKSQVIIELEVDKRKVLHKGNDEIAFSECNIIGLVTPKDFILKNYPQCKALLDLYDKAMDNPDLYGNQYIQEEQMQCGQLRNLERKLNTSNLEIQASQFEIIKTYSINNSKPSDIHGLSHWKNVERNAILLAEKTGADLQALKVFAYVHDMCRENDGGDPDHGLRASRYLKKYAVTFLNGMDDSIIHRLCFACEHHTDMQRSGDLLIDTCFDADRLDLTRVGITPDPAKMATDVGAYYAANPDIYKAEIKKVQL
ncbi:MAG: pentapeptide repeat-containing protein [Bacteroidales bacterium]|nr:pentapeptide repeat-containing protein [Bacteroidales bacterium]